MSRVLESLIAFGKGVREANELMNNLMSDCWFIKLGSQVDLNCLSGVFLVLQV
ncbi:hypothetical protein D8674_009725 [Pyrus ussuriensis x Pyrus communis]|uniref:Uncharacterized protein n=1 Tax=Pyrus ussuriensis x Pyrus communis TaxID=2448454 RepID=A0A5N5FME9_9ROSA|nr:hypothetical protein D8674_009725 [Pyrus ussuriensis x Pyrus communis]